MTDDRERLEEMAVGLFPGSDPKKLGPIEWRTVAMDLLRQLREREWQPIETAPTDQTIDLYTAWAGVRDTDCHWDPHSIMWVHWADEGDGPCWIEVPNPTHWKRIDKPKEEPHE